MQRYQRPPSGRDVRLNALCLVESFIAMLRKGCSFVGFSHTKSGLAHVENNDNGTAREPRLHGTEI